MKPPTTRYLLQELLVQLRKLNGDERLKSLEDKVDRLTGNQKEDRRRHEALIKHLKVDFIYQKESYEKTVSRSRTRRKKSLL